MSARWVTIQRSDRWRLDCTIRIRSRSCVSSGLQSRVVVGRIVGCCAAFHNWFLVLTLDFLAEAAAEETHCAELVRWSLWVEVCVDRVWRVLWSSRCVWK